MSTKICALIAAGITALMVAPPALAGALGDPFTIAVAAVYSFLAAMAAAGIAGSKSRT